MRTTVPPTGALPYAGHRRTCYTAACAELAPAAGTASSVQLRCFVETALATGLVECVCALLTVHDVDAAKIHVEDEIIVDGLPFLVTHVARFRDWIAYTIVGNRIKVHSVTRESMVRRVAQPRDI